MSGYISFEYEQKKFPEKYKERISKFSGWKKDSHGGLYNNNFGEVKRVFVLDNNSEPLFDQYLIK